MITIASAFGQTEDNKIPDKEMFTRILQRSKIQYDPPKEYEQLYIGQNAQIEMILLTASWHQLKASKDSLFVYFTALEIDTTKASAEKLKKFGLYSDPNKNYLKTNSDTLSYPVKYDPRDFTLKKYSADRSGTFDLSLPKRYKNEYTFCKVLFIHKDDRADIKLFFFYNSIDPDKLEKHIKRIADHIKFKG